MRKRYVLGIAAGLLVIIVLLTQCHKAKKPGLPQMSEPSGQAQFQPTEVTPTESRLPTEGTEPSKPQETDNIPTGEPAEGAEATTLPTTQPSQPAEPIPPIPENPGNTETSQPPISPEIAQTTPAVTEPPATTPPIEEPELPSNPTTPAETQPPVTEPVTEPTEPEPTGCNHEWVCIYHEEQGHWLAGIICDCGWTVYGNLDEVISLWNNHSASYSAAESLLNHGGYSSMDQWLIDSPAYEEWHCDKCGEHKN